MSFAKSPALAPTELSDALQTALINVCENAYFVFVEPCDAPQLATLVEKVRAERGHGPAGRWLNASVAFNGASSGFCDACFTGRYPVPLAEDMRARQLHLFEARDR